MIPILFVEVALIAFYFISVNYMTDKTVGVMSQTAMQSLVNVSDLETRYINKQLKYLKQKTYEFHEKYQTGLDTSFDSFVGEMLPTGLPWGSGALILDADGKMLITSHEFQKLVDKSVMGDDYSDITKPYVKHDFKKELTPVDLALRSYDY